MNLSEAYNRKSLIDENWVIDQLKEEWRLVHNGYSWGADVKLYGKTVWVSLSFGYKDCFQSRAMFYSSFGINSRFVNESYTARNDYCWGKLQPSAPDVIWYYYNEIRTRLFPHGPRNKAEFII